MAITYEEIMSDLGKRIFKPIYFLAGEEPYYIDLIVDYIEQNVLEESEKAFNQIILYGEETTITNVIEVARRFPMMARHQVVIVKEAQSLKKLDELIKYVEHPLESTILVLSHKYKSLDKRLSLGKTLQKMGCYFESAKLRDYQVPAWIDKYLSARGVKASQESSAMLTSFLGTDLGKIANELDKLIISLPKENPVITPELIESNIGISKDFNNFELQKAVGEKNAYKANLIIRYFNENHKANPLTLTIGMLFSFFSKVLLYHYTKDKSNNNMASVLKVNPYFVKDYASAASKYNIAKTVRAIRLLRQFDLKSKGFDNAGTEDGDLLRELVFKIMR